MKEEKDNIIAGHLKEIEELKERAEKAEAEVARLKAELEASKGEVRPFPPHLMLVFTDQLHLAPTASFGCLLMPGPGPRRQTKR